jgi:hypothetical protein
VSDDRLNDEMVRVSHAAPINITGWHFFDDEDRWRDLMAAGFAVYINETLENVFEKNPPHAWFPCAWCRNNEDGVGGKCPDDLATLYFGVPLGPTEDEVCWSISLEKVIAEFIEVSDQRHVYTGLAGRLRELAKMLDDAANDVPEETAA